MKIYPDSTDLLKLNSENRMTIEHRRIGADQMPVMVVDDFFQFPERVRSFALSLHYERPLPGDYWPGIQAAASLDRTEIERFIKSHFVEGQLGLSIGSFYFPPLRPGEAPEQWTSFFLQSRFGMITMGPREAPWVNLPHVDEFGFVASVIYLSDPPQSQGGTVLCRHRNTGIQCIPPYVQGLPKELVSMLKGTRSFQIIRDRIFGGSFAHVGMPSVETNKREQRSLLTVKEHEEVWTAIMSGAEAADSYMTRETEQWEILDQVDMRFNRLVAYPTWQLHGVNWDMKFAGISKAEQRMTMMNWLNYPVPQRMSQHVDKKEMHKSYLGVS